MERQYYPLYNWDESDPPSALWSPANDQARLDWRSSGRACPRSSGQNVTLCSSAIYSLSHLQNHCHATCSTPWRSDGNRVGHRASLGYYTSTMSRPWRRPPLPTLGRGSGRRPQSCGTAEIRTRLGSWSDGVPRGRPWVATGQRWATEEQRAVRREHAARQRCWGYTRPGACRHAGTQQRVRRV